MKRIMLLGFLLAVIGCTSPSQSWTQPDVSEKQTHRDWVRCKDKEHLGGGTSARSFRGKTREECMKEKGYRLKRY